MEHEIYCGKKRLRCGVSTGACAAAAAKAAAQMLLGVCLPTVEITLPDHSLLTLPVTSAPDGGVAVQKDGGDDVDATHGLLICAKLRLLAGDSIEIRGGEGVGRVTLPGLEQPVGAYAINQVPRRMITQSVREVLGEAQGAQITIYVPGGEAAAKRTANPRLGIVGGISILGTTGIVKPMSQDALIASIHLELRTAQASGSKIALLTPGNYGESFLLQQYAIKGAVMCSNFIGESIDHAAALGFHGCLLVGHIGKLVKLAGGIFQTHSAVADARMEILTAHAALAGANQTLLHQLMEQPTTDSALDLLETENLLAPVLTSLLEKIDIHLSRRGGDMPVGAILYCNRRGILGQTRHAGQLLDTRLHNKTT